MITLDDVITGVLQREGWPKYTNDPTDKGGPTKGGITLKTLQEWRSKTGSTQVVTEADVAALTEWEVRAIYHQMYVTDWHFDQIPNDWVKIFVVDTGVLQGQAVAAKMLQVAIHVTPDGQIGPTTLVSLQSALLNLQRLKADLIRARMNLLLEVMVMHIPVEQRQTTNLKYRHGWWNRVADFL